MNITLNFWTVPVAILFSGWLLAVVIGWRGMFVDRETLSGCAGLCVGMFGTLLAIGIALVSLLPSTLHTPG